MNKIDNINWMPQKDYDKAVGQLRLQIGGIFEPFKSYGQDVFIPSAREECIKL